MQTLIEKSPWITAGLFNLVAWADATTTGDSHSAILTTLGTMAIPALSVMAHYVIATWGPKIKESVTSYAVSLMERHATIRSNSLAGQFDKMVEQLSDITSKFHSAESLAASKDRTIEMLNRQLANQDQSHQQQLEAISKSFEAQINILIKRFDDAHFHRLNNMAQETPEWQKTIDEAIERIEGKVTDTNARVVENIQAITKSPSA